MRFLKKKKGLLCRERKRPSFKGKKVYDIFLITCEKNPTRGVPAEKNESRL